eukprot:NODE_958_length_2221_cov_40.483794_g819_i0.p1 GENE.NODE_958_length_2221_cov_40.483794_g819_i0~~NODE_958_length_2221_cov_40.483794_g819_i0.p1  ORF type:complete len:607 (-),score=74.48 NODE_958_length_2221_cov_40.483794_g819_i0:319-2139(-)
MEVSVFLLARQLIRPNILVIDTRDPIQFQQGTRLRCAVLYTPDLPHSEIGQRDYERIICYGPRALEVANSFGDRATNIFRGDIEAFAGEFPQFCWVSLSEAQLAEAIPKPRTLIVHTYRDGFTNGPRLRKAVHYIPGVGFTGWDKRQVSGNWYKKVICYGPNAFAAAEQFTSIPVCVFTGSIRQFAKSHPNLIFDIRRNHGEAHEYLCNPFLTVAESLFLGNLSLPSHIYKEKNISHAIVFTHKAKEENDEAWYSSGADFPPVIQSNNQNFSSPHKPTDSALLVSPPLSPNTGPKSPPNIVIPDVKMIHLEERGSEIHMFRLHDYSEFLKLSPVQNESKHEETVVVDLVWTVEILKSLIKNGHRVILLCELGISRSTAIATAYLHIAKGLSPSESINRVVAISACCHPSPILGTLAGFKSRSEFTTPYRDLVISPLLPSVMCGSYQSMCGSRKHDSALDPSVFQRHGITHVLSLGERQEGLGALNLKTLFVDLDDSERGGLLNQLAVCFAFMDEATMEGGAVLVHCLAGVSRTGALIIAYLMYHCRLTLKDALHYAWKKRPILQPNDGFVVELFQLELDIFKKPSLAMESYRDWELAHKWCLNWGV